MEKITPQFLRTKKKNKEKIVALTAYDCPTAQLLDEAGVDIILVGDSLGMVVLGYENTLPVTMDEMIHHTKAVVRGTKRALVVGDMPFLSYCVSTEKTVENAGRFVKDAGAQAVKIEGGKEHAETVRMLVSRGIPVLGHIGLKPQHVLELSGYKVQGKDSIAANEIIRDAEVLAQSGVFALILECVPADLAGRITSAISVPTIGIGAGPLCDGQILVTQDIVGLTGRKQPKFVKTYSDVASIMKQTVETYSDEVRKKTFPDEEHSY